MHTYRNRWLIAVVVIAVATLAAGCLPTENWGQFGFNERHTGFPSQETTITSSNVSSLAVRWTVPDAGSSGNASPLVADGRLFVFGDTTRVYSTISHALLWEKAVPAHSAAVVGDRLFVLSDSSSWPTTSPAVETILDVATGNTVGTYSYPAANFRSGVIALDGVLWFAVSATGGGAPSTLYRQTGTAAPQKLYSSSAFDFNGDLVEYNGLVDALGYASGKPAVAGINSTSGKQSWIGLLPRAPSNGDWGAFHISAAYDRVFVTGVEGVAALSSSSGSVRWVKTKTLCGPTCYPWLPDEVVYGRVATADNRVYVSAWGGQFALAPDDGDVLWHYGTTGDADASPSVANGLVYTFMNTAQGRALVVLTESGGTLKKTVVGVTAIDPVIYGGQVYVRDETGGDLRVLGVS